MIQTDSLTKRHGDIVAVDDVTIELGDGLTAIIGPNGAGKSTLLCSIGRLIRADAGRVVVGGLDVATTRSRDLARRLAVLRQENHLPIRLSVEELVGFGRFPHGGNGRSVHDRARIENALDLLGLEPVRGRFLDELSGGQRQRAFVAMALAQDTDYLLLDEPLNDLDPRHAVELMRLLTRLVTERDLRIVVVLHDLNVAARYADEVVAMREGRVVAQGSVEQVITVEQLSDLFETPARVAEVEGRRIVLWE